MRKIYASHINQCSVCVCVFEWSHDIAFIRAVQIAAYTHTINRKRTQRITVRPMCRIHIHCLTMISNFGVLFSCAGCRSVCCAPTSCNVQTWRRNFNLMLLVSKSEMTMWCCQPKTSPVNPQPYETVYIAQEKQVTFYLLMNILINLMPACCCCCCFCCYCKCSVLGVPLCRSCIHIYIYIVCRHNTVWTTSIHPSIWIVAVKERITSENDTEKKFKGPFYLHLSLKYLSFTVCVGYTYIYVLGSCVTFCTCHARTTENVVCFCRRTEKIFRYVENDFGRQFETRGVEFIRRHLISGTHHAPNLLATRIHIHMIMMAYLF